MVAALSRITVVLVTFLARDVSSFSTIRSDGVMKLSSTQHLRLSSPPRTARLLLSAGSNDDDQDVLLEQKQMATSNNTRRSILKQVISTSAILSSSLLTGGSISNAAMGTLPEFEDTNAIFQGITIDVTDKASYEQSIEFFTSCFDGMKVLRERGVDGGVVVKETWLGFGPETLSIPPSFELPVSSFAQYGGHASIHLRYDPKDTSLLYKRSSGEFNNEPAPGDSIAYLQLGVPQYRISQMVKYGGNVIDAYGWVNVVSPAGLPIRSIVGIRPDPMMFLAINCADVKQSEEFYNKLGFVRQDYPYARLNSGQGQFEPPQPNKSVYLAPSPNSMGVLLLQNKNKKKAVVPNPVLRSINVVYNAPGDDGASSSSGAPVNVDPTLMDPSSVPVSFVPLEYLEKEIKFTTKVSAESS
mmetsp:Transcript_6134/g.9392  ORF Transcript_6134/g.9392 Transcript_6134/m.9392 type:complete len:413 (+) Transcript_6134:132-1370(+)